eukprot:COSAG01_NODE_72955_length_251_cov_1.322368_1_plen_59_part_01
MSAAGDFAKAVETFNQALAINPQDLVGVSDEIERERDEALRKAQKLKEQAEHEVESGDF